MLEKCMIYKIYRSQICLESVVMTNYYSCLSLLAKSINYNLIQIFMARKTPVMSCSEMNFFQN